MIRWAGEKDYPAISEMLSDEGISFDEQKHETYPTWVCDDDGEIVGFYSLKLIGDIPAIQHLCVKRGKRLGARVVRAMLHFFKNWCRDNGQKYVYVHADKDKPRVKKAIEYYFKVKPHYEVDKRYWYLLTIGG